MMREYKDIVNTFIYYDYKKNSCLAIYDKQNWFSLREVLKHTDDIKEDSFVVTVNR